MIFVIVVVICHVRVNLSILQYCFYEGWILINHFEKIDCFFLEIYRCSSNVHLWKLFSFCIICRTSKLVFYGKSCWWHSKAYFGWFIRYSSNRFFILRVVIPMLKSGHFVQLILYTPLCFFIWILLLIGEFFIVLCHLFIIVLYLMKFIDNATIKFT